MSASLRISGNYRVWGHGDFVHVCFESPGCTFRKKGFCVMCDYGAGDRLITSSAINALRSAMTEWRSPIRGLLLGTCGSIFDESEMMPETLFALAKEIAATDIEKIIFETHYSTVKPELLKRIQEILPNKRILIELGFESSNPSVLKNSLNKYMDLGDLKTTIKLIKAYGMNVILNVFLGAPGLTEAEQVEDALNSLRWAYDNGADEAVVFPANIKPNTPLWNKFQCGEYPPISSWLLVELLSQLTDNELTKTSISWFGDRQYLGVDTDIISPKTCPECTDALMGFYSSFMDDFDAGKRRLLLSRICAYDRCDCWLLMKQRLMEG